MSAEDISAFAAIVSAFVSILALLIAKQSTGAAKASADIASKVLQRSIVTELLVGCRELVAEELSIQSIVVDLKSAINSHFVANGSYSGTRKDLITNALDKDLVSIASHTQEAKKILTKSAELFAASEADIDLIYCQIEAGRAQLRVIKESMLRRLGELN